jgi:hypothetical protein
MLLDKPICLCKGAGNGVDQACLMTAANMLCGKGDMGDAAEGSCVCPIIRAFIIPTNDRMPSNLRSELYGPLAWEIVGTASDDRAVWVRRAGIFADAAAELAKIAAAADAAAYAVYAAAAGYAAAYAAYAAAANAAAANADADDVQRQIWTICRDAILSACAVGDKRPVERTITAQQLVGALSA